MIKIEAAGDRIAFTAPYNPATAGPSGPAPWIYDTEFQHSPNSNIGWSWRIAVPQQGYAVAFSWLATWAASGSIPAGSSTGTGRLNVGCSTGDMHDVPDAIATFSWTVTAATKDGPAGFGGCM